MDGLRLQVAALAQALAEEHDVRIVAYGRPEDTGRTVGKAALRVVRREEPPRLTRMMKLGADELRQRPFGLDDLSAGLAGALADELAEFDPDIIHVASGKLAGLHKYLAGRPAVLAALDATHVNIEAQAANSQGIRRRHYLHQAQLMRRFIADEFPSFNRVVVVSERDRAELEQIVEGVAVDVITNGVDADRFAPDSGTERKRGRLVFTGALNYPPNVSAAVYLAEQVMPLVREARPDASLVLVGRAPSAAVTELDGLEGVDVVGEVPEMSPWLSSSWAYVCPMRSGTGIKNKLLEALANGLPCIATPIATQGMHLTPGVEVLVAQDASSIARLVISVLANEELARDVGEAGRRYVLANHSWEAVGRAYSELYKTLLSAGNRSADIDHNEKHDRPGVGDTSEGNTS
jgi:glycosyltransferase involved in cell wall biosynthesis